jgi:hypothetical protein
MKAAHTLYAARPSQNTRMPCHANGPVLKKYARPAGMNRNPTHRFA